MVDPAITTSQLVNFQLMIFKEPTSQRKLLSTLTSHCQLAPHMIAGSKSGSDVETGNKAPFISLIELVNTASAQMSGLLLHCFFKSCTILSPNGFAEAGFWPV